MIVKGKCTEEEQYLIMNIVENLAKTSSRITISFLDVREACLHLLVNVKTSRLLTIAWSALARQDNP